MSKAKFTKGRWKILDGFQVGVKVDFGDGFFTLASCQVFNEGRANAHLIATAPEMYEDIEADILFLADILETEQNLSGATIKLIETKLRRKSRLLSKARGEL